MTFTMMGRCERTEQLGVASGYREVDESVRSRRSYQTSQIGIMRVDGSQWVRTGTEANATAATASAKATSPWETHSRTRASSKRWHRPTALRLYTRALERDRR